MKESTQKPTSAQLVLKAWRNLDRESQEDLVIFMLSETEIGRHVAPAVRRYIPYDKWDRAVSRIEGTSP